MLAKNFRAKIVKSRISLLVSVLLLINSVSAVFANSTSNNSETLLDVPSQPTLISPDSQAGITPTYQWTPVGGAEDYAIFVGAEDESEPPKISGYFTVDCTTECSFTPNVELTINKTYLWWVAGRNGEGLGEPSETKTFLTAPPPNTVVLVSPNSTTPQETTTPNYQWNFEEGVSEYRLFVQNSIAQNVVDQWYDSSSICVDDTCEATPNTTLSAGEYNWWVIAKNEFGESEPGASEVFNVLLQPPSKVDHLIKPTGISSPAPEFSWDPVDTATAYRLIALPDQTGEAAVIDQTFTSEQLGCAGGSQACVLQWDVNLSAEVYRWTVQASNNSTLDVGYGIGNGPPSDPEIFEVPLPPDQPTLIAPSGDTATITPDFIWNHQATAIKYLVSLRKGTVTIFENWYLVTDPDLTCDENICTLPSPVNLDVNFYTWSVIAVGYGGSSPTSDEMDFTITQMSLHPVAITEEALADGHAYGPSISEDGQVIAFYSYASDIVSGCGDPTPNKDHAHPENYKTDVFLYDRSTNPPTITCVSRNSDGEIGNNSSMNPVISSGGQLVTFVSKATNFVKDENSQTWTGDDNGKQDVFVHDSYSGDTVIISIANDGSLSNDDSTIGMITDDGQRAAFTSLGSNLTDIDDTNGTTDVFLRDLARQTTEMVSKGFFSADSGNAASEGFSISDDGRFIAFQSLASDLTPQDDFNNSMDIFLWKDGSMLPISVASNSLGMGNKASFGPFLSSNGLYIVYYTSATNLTATNCGDPNGDDEFEKDIIIYVTDTSENPLCVSVSEGSIAHGADINNSPSISRNGRILVFETDNSLIEDDNNNLKDIYAYDRSENSIRLISKNTDGQPGNDISNRPVISGIGVNIAFASSATNFVDGENFKNVYYTDLTGIVNYAPPTSLIASEITDVSVKLSWRASPDYEFIDGYRIYQNNVAIQTTSEEEIVINGLESVTDYNFKVRAYSSTQESIPTNSVKITTDMSSTSAEVQVSIGGNVMGNYTVARYEEKRLYYDVSGGPVIIESLNNREIVAAIRLQAMQNEATTDQILNSFIETMGVPEGLLSDKYYFPTYNNTWGPLNSQIRFGNLSAETTRIRVTIGKDVVWENDVPGQEERRLYFDVSGGPVIIESLDETKIVAAIRLQSMQNEGLPNQVLHSFAETMGIPAEQLSDRYYFPTYNNTWGPLNSQVRFGNLSTETTRIRVTIGKNIVWEDNVPGQEERRLYFNANGGPVIIESLDETKIVAAIRLQSIQNEGLPDQVLNSFSETMGIPAGQLSDRYYFPTYNNTWGPLNSQARFAVP